MTDNDRPVLIPRPPLPPPEPAPLKELVGQAKEIVTPEMVYEQFRGSPARNRMGHCPNTEGHNRGDRTPSLSFGGPNAGKAWKCFGCDARGDAIHLIEMFNPAMSRSDAMRELCAMANLSTDEPHPPPDWTGPPNGRPTVQDTTSPITTPARVYDTPYAMRSAFYGVDSDPAFKDASGLTPSELDLIFDDLVELRDELSGEGWRVIVAVAADVHNGEPAGLEAVKGLSLGYRDLPEDCAYPGGLDRLAADWETHDSASAADYDTLREIRAGARREQGYEDDDTPGNGGEATPTGPVGAPAADATPPAQLPLKKRDMFNLQAAYSDLGIRVRFNLQNNQGEVWLPEQERWAALNRYQNSGIIGRVNRAYDWGTGNRKNLSRDAWTLLHEQLVAYNEVHPFRDYLTGLPPWDSSSDTPRLDNLISSVWPDTQLATPDAEAVARWGPYFMLAGAVRRAYQPGARHDTCLVLIGGQGIGKSHFAQLLLPDPEWYGSVTFRTGMGAVKDMWERTQGRVIVELSEAIGLSRASTSALKQWITDTKDRVRVPYDRDPLDFPREFVLIVTSNEPHPLPDDPSGHRRYMVIHLPNKAPSSVHKIYENMASYMKANRDNLWRETIWRLQQKNYPYFAQAVPELATSVEEVAEDASYHAPINDLLAQLPDEEINGKVLHQIYVLIYPDHKGAVPYQEVRELSKALRHRGLVAKRSRRPKGKRVLTFWVPEPAS